MSDIIPIREKGRFVKGQPTANPKGRPRTGHALAEAIRSCVDPLELAEIAIGIARATENEPKYRLTAVKFLADHGWSKPVVEVEQVRQPLDFSRLTDDQIALLTSALENDDERDGE